MSNGTAVAGMVQFTHRPGRARPWDGNSNIRSPRLRPVATIRKEPHPMNTPVGPTHVATTTVGPNGWHNVICSVCGHLVAMSGAKVAANRAAKHERLNATAAEATTD